MTRRLQLLAAAALLAGCTATATGTVTPGASPSPGASASPAAASTAPGASTAPSAGPSATASTAPALGENDFVPTTLTLSIDGKSIPIQQRGNRSLVEEKQLGVSLGVFAKEKGSPSNPAIPTMTIVSSAKAITAADFGVADAATLSIGINWLDGMSLNSYGKDAGAAITLTSAGGKLDLTYKGKMNLVTGAGGAAKTIEVDLVAKGIPAAK